MTTPAFTQTDRPRWPSGSTEQIAVTRVSPDLLSRAFGLDFQGGSEGAAIRMGSGRTLRLARRTRGQRSTTEVHADAGDDFVSALREFLDAFDLSAQDLSWMRPEIRAAIRVDEPQVPT